MLRALLYLRLTSLKNVAAARTRRLREPKYLFGALATIGYFYYFVFRRFSAAMGGAHARAFDPLVLGSSIGILILILAWVVGAWTFPSLGGLRFTPAEIAFLFPAPLSRRTLVNFSLASSQLKLLLTSALLGLVWSRRNFSWEGSLLHVAGWWMILSAAELHRTAANLTFAARKERGLDMARSRILAIGVIGLFAAAVAVAVWREAPPSPGVAGFATPQVWGAYLATLFNTGAMRWLLLPFRLVAGPFLATGGRAFLSALGPALLVLAAHYYWILRLDVSFAEGSMSLAEKRSQRIAARQAGGSVFASRPSRRLREPFRLAAQGRPEGAFLWKNLFSITGAVNWRLLLIGGIMLFPFIAAFSLTAPRGGHSPFPLIVAGLSAMVGAYALLWGPRFIRQDLRGDLQNVDLLKTYPLAGWQVVFGEMLAPIALLSSIVWLMLLGAGWGAAASNLAGLSAPGPYLAGMLCAAVLTPLVCALEFMIPNAAMLLFPAWHQTTRSRSGGLEMVGQRLIFSLGQILAVILLLLPAALAFPVLMFATSWLIGVVPAMIIATAAALVIIGFELFCGLWWLGRLFERLDLSAETGP